MGTNKVLHASKAPVTYACHLDLLRILRSSLSILENAEFTSDEAARMESVKCSLRDAVMFLELAIRANSAERLNAENQRL
jgi:hypothetical protein